MQRPSVGYDDGGALKSGKLLRLGQFQGLQENGTEVGHVELEELSIAGEHGNLCVRLLVRRSLSLRAYLGYARGHLRGGRRAAR